MEKSKRKNKPNRRRLWIILGVLTTSIAFCSWAFSYYVIPGHSLSYFSRFESSDEVVAFLHDNFDLYVTTSDEILTFMDDYPLEYDGCRDWIPGRGDFEGYEVDEDIVNIIICTVPKRHELFTSAYRITFYINTDNLLEYISAKHIWLNYL